MNRRYLLWQLSRDIRQPATLFLAGMYITILAGIIFFVSIDVSGQTILSVRLGTMRIDEPSFLLATMLPSLANVLSTLSLFLYLMAATGAGAESLYHPMNHILLVTPLTRTRLLLTSYASTAFVYTIGFAAFILLFHLIIGLKTGWYAWSPALASVGWTALLYASCSALVYALLPFFRKASTVLILLAAILFLASLLADMHELHFRILAILLPPLTNYQSAAMNALFPSPQLDNLLLPSAMSMAYLCIGMFSYSRQDVK